MSKCEIKLLGEEKPWFIVVGNNKKILSKPTRLDDKGEIIIKDKDKSTDQWCENIEKIANTISVFGLVVCYTDFALSIIEEIDKDIFVGNSFL